MYHSPKEAFVIVHLSKTPSQLLTKLIMQNCFTSTVWPYQFDTLYAYCADDGLEGFGLELNLSANAGRNVGVFLCSA